MKKNCKTDLGKSYIFTVISSALEPTDMNKILMDFKEIFSDSKVYMSKGSVCMVSPYTELIKKQIESVVPNYLRSNV